MIKNAKVLIHLHVYKSYNEQEWWAPLTLLDYISKNYIERKWWVLLHWPVGTTGQMWKETTIPHYGFYRRANRSMKVPTIVYIYLQVTKVNVYTHISTNKLFHITFKKDLWGPSPIQRNPTMMIKRPTKQHKTEYQPKKVRVYDFVLSSIY